MLINSRGNTDENNQHNSSKSLAKLRNLETLIHGCDGLNIIKNGFEDEMPIRQLLCQKISALRRASSLASSSSIAPTPSTAKTACAVSTFTCFSLSTSLPMASSTKILSLSKIKEMYHWLLSEECQLMIVASEKRDQRITSQQINPLDLFAI
eukprot:Awhi_evm1s9444